MTPVGQQYCLILSFEDGLAHQRVSVLAELSQQSEGLVRCCKLRIVIEVIIGVRIVVAIAPVTSKSALETEREEVFQLQKIQSAEYEGRSYLQRLIGTLVVVHDDQMISLGEHILHDAVVLVTIGHVGHEDELAFVE